MLLGCIIGGGGQDCEDGGPGGLGDKEPSEREPGPQVQVTAAAGLSYQINRAGVEAE